MAVAAVRGSSSAIKVAVGAACVLAVLSVCAAAAVNVDVTEANPGPGSHNITIGHRNKCDILLYQGVARVNVSTTLDVQSADMCYPPYQEPPNTNISAITVTDLMPKGEAGYAAILSGGVNHHEVCLQLTTQPNKGYHFNINVWGKYV